MTKEKQGRASALPCFLCPTYPIKQPLYGAGRIFRVSLPDKAIFIKILITNGKQLRLKQSSSPIHIVLQHPMSESRKLPAAQYDTVHHGAKHPAVRHQPPLLSGGREGVPALPQQQENTGGMGLQEALR